MIAEVQVNLEVFAVVLKAVLALNYYRQVFAVARVSELQMLFPLLILVLVKVFMIVVVNVDLVKARARVLQITVRVSPERVSPAIVNPAKIRSQRSLKIVRIRRSPKIRVSPSKLASPEIVIPARVSNIATVASPVRAVPERASQERASPERAAKPVRASPARASPERASSSRASLRI